MYLEGMPFLTLLSFFLAIVNHFRPLCSEDLIIISYYIKNKRLAEGVNSHL